MIRKIVTVLILLPLALAIVLFAVANRAAVTVALDPFAGEPPMFAVALPLFSAAAARADRRRHHRRRRRLDAPEQLAPPRAPPLGRPEGRARRGRDAAAPARDAAPPRSAAAAEARSRRSRTGIRPRHDLMRVVTADEIDRALTYPALVEALREAFRADIAAPLRHHHMIAQPGGSEAKLLLMPAWTDSGERLRRLQDRHASIPTTPRSKAVGLRQLPADVGRHRRAARRDGRHRADRLAHRLRLGARRVLSGARGRRASRDGRRGRARAASGARARGVRPIKRVTHLEPHARPCRAGRLRARGRRARGRGRRRSRSRGARGRHRVVRDALRDAAGARQVARRRARIVDLVGAYTPKMREADDDAVQARARLCRHPRRRAEGGAATSRSR